MVVPVELGVGDGAGLGVGAGLAEPGGGGVVAPPAVVLDVTAAGGAVVAEVDCIEAEPPPQPAMNISNEAKTRGVTARGGTRRISQF
jgi:hypothetical protein